MSTVGLAAQPSTQGPGERVWRKILRASMALPGARVNRSEFLWSQLWPHCEPPQIQRAIETRPAQAGVSIELIDRLADSCIKAHVAKASGISFVTGIPGGIAGGATIPVDIAQFYWHAIVLAQKLAYLYGLPDLLEDGEVDEETEILITLLIGAMMGAQIAQKGLVDFAERLATQVAKRLPRKALTRYAFYNLSKQVGRWIGVSVTKSSFSRGIAKVIPLVGAAASACVTAGMMYPMGKRLKTHLKGLRLAQPGVVGG